MLVSFYNNGIYNQSTMNSMELFDLLFGVSDKSLLIICDIQFDDNDYGDYKYQDFKEDTDISFAQTDFNPVMFVVLGMSKDGSIKRYIVDELAVLRERFKVTTDTIAEDSFCDYVTEDITLDCLLGTVNLSKDFVYKMEQDLCW